MKLLNKTVWAITPEMLQTMMTIARQNNKSPEAVASQLGKEMKNTNAVSIRDGVAVIRVTGPLFRYANLFTRICGAIRQSITQPLMNGISSYFGFATAHTGGIIGADNLSTKSANLSVFSGAPKFHSGGIVGDEVPIIAKRGEGVFTKEQMKALGDNGSTVNISVNVINNASSDVKASVSKSNQGNGKFSLDIMIEKIESSISKNVSKEQA